MKEVVIGVHATGVKKSNALQKGWHQSLRQRTHASRARAGAKLACGATLSATREFVGLAWLVNSAGLWQVFLFRGIISDLRHLLQLLLLRDMKCGSNKKPRHFRDAV